MPASRKKTPAASPKKKTPTATRRRKSVSKVVKQRKPSVKKSRKSRTTKTSSAVVERVPIPASVVEAAAADAVVAVTAAAAAAATEATALQKQLEMYQYLGFYPDGDHGDQSLDHICAEALMAPIFNVLPKVMVQGVSQYSCLFLPKGKVRVCAGAEPDCDNEATAEAKCHKSLKPIEGLKLVLDVADGTTVYYGMNGRKVIADKDGQLTFA